MKNILTRLLCGLALWCMAALPVSAEEMHGPPPQSGTSITPSPRFICLMPGMLEIAFKNSQGDMAKIHAGLQAIGSITINGEPACFFVRQFGKPLTVVDATKVGNVSLPDQSEFDAYELHLKGGNDLDVYALWLEMTKDAPKVLYHCNDCI